MRVYIAGPYTDADDRRVKANIRNADKAAREVLRKGHIPFCPHKMMAWWEKDTRFVEEDFMRVRLEWLSHCEAVVAVGLAKVELEKAKELGLHVFLGTEHLPTTAQETKNSRRRRRERRRVAATK